jgi:hypothetical protein
MRNSPTNFVPSSIKSPFQFITLFFLVNKLAD